MKLAFQVVCSICDKPMDLTTDLCTDEDGQGVHSECYEQVISDPPGRIIPSSKTKPDIQ
jgi:hypothetical protein